MSIDNQASGIGATNPAGDEVVCEASGSEKQSIEESTPSTSSVQNLTIEKHTNVCFFCDQARKKRNYHILPLYNSKEIILKQKIKDNATALSDTYMFEKINEIALIDDICYHNICKTAYFNKYIAAPTSKHTDWHTKRNFHELAYKDICNFVQENIINNKSCYLLNLLTDYYKRTLAKLFTDKFE